MPHWMVEKMRKITITAAPNFDAESMEMLVSGLKQRFGEVEISTVTDEKSAGGFSVDLDGTVYDMTVEAQLSKLKQHFAE